MTGTSVVPETSGVTEDQFHGAMIAGLGRCERRVGLKALAFVMDVTTKGLGNIFRGSAPHPKRLWDARSADPTVMDDIADLYGVRLVPKDAALIGELGTLPIAELLARVAEAESPDSPGGVAKTHQELLAMEPSIRAVRHLLDGWIEQIDQLRAPRIVKS